MQELSVQIDSEEREGSTLMRTSAQEDFRIPGYRVEAVDDDDGERNDGGDEDACPYHSLYDFPPTLQKSTLNRYSEVDEEDQ